MRVEFGVVRHNPEELSVGVVIEDQRGTSCFEWRLVLPVPLLAYLNHGGGSVGRADLRLAERQVHPSRTDHADAADEVEAAGDLLLGERSSDRTHEQAREQGGYEERGGEHACFAD